MDTIEFGDDERNDMEELLLELDRTVVLAAEENDSVKAVINKFGVALNELVKNGPTAKLWMQYFRMITLVKHFIEAERSGNWKLHLTTIQRMLPYFHASGHYLYMKSAYLYLQNLLNLRNKMPADDNEKFTTEGYITIRRTNKFWSGIMSNQAIEQTLNRESRISGGLYGRGASESVATRWTMGAHGAQVGSIPKREPMFISRSETFKFIAGETINLPCEVSNSEPYIVAWKRGIAILSAGITKVTPDPRVRLVNGFNLQIRDSVPQDAGDYICQIATLEPREITHTVEILVPSRINHISSGGHLQVKKGSSVRIECSASGNPTPNITWSRKNNVLPNGEEKLHSPILSVESMDRHKAGVYVCEASNGVGKPAVSQVVLHVLYPPEITTERPVVYSGEGHEAMLVCIVHGEAQPEVIWFKDTMQLDTTERHIMENRGSRHTLIIRKVHPQDFGNYSCVAENQLGKSRKTLQLSGKPNSIVFRSPPISQFKDRYNISCTVDSHTPVEEFKLFYRRLPQGHEVDNTIEQTQSLQTLQHPQNTPIYGHNYRAYGNGVHWSRNDWRDVVLPAVPLSHLYTQGMSYMIRGLEADQQYEARVQARNRYGWSAMSESFLFSTSTTDGYSHSTSFLNHGLSDSEMRDLSVTFYGSSAVTISWPSLRFLCIFIPLSFLV